MTIEGFETVERDVQQGIGTIFTPAGDGLRVHENFEDVEVLGAKGILVVPWVYTCQHSGDLNGLFTTGRTLDMHGVTIIDERTNTVLRYVDWLGVISQLGVEVNWRVPVEEKQYTDILEILNAQ